MTKPKTDFHKRLELADLERKLEASERATASVRRERDRQTSRANTLSAEVEELRSLLNMHDAIKTSKPRPPTWLTPKRKTSQHRATLVAFLSDTHFDEVVEPVRMGGVNAYNRDIATMRLRRFAEKTLLLARDYSAGVKFDGLVLALGGDIFSGDIHDELRRTNEDSMLGSLLYWQEQLSACIFMLLEEFGKIHIPCTFGNHGRTTEKPLINQEARTNFDWFLSKQLERTITDPRVTWDVPEARDTYFTAYDTTICMNHGNETSGGGGIGGIFPPIMRMKAKKAERDAALNVRWDALMIGHWHQEIFAPQQGIIVNPSMKGYDTFARRHNFRPERPAQLAYLITPEHGITDGRPIIVGDKKQEGW